MLHLPQLWDEQCLLSQEEMHKLVCGRPQHSVHLARGEQLHSQLLAHGVQLLSQLLAHGRLQHSWQLLQLQGGGHSHHQVLGHCSHHLPQLWQSRAKVQQADQLLTRPHSQAGDPP